MLSFKLTDLSFSSSFAGTIFAPFGGAVITVPRVEEFPLMLAVVALALMSL